MKKQTVYVGMSGGVDSSVCAYILKQSGYEVVGVYMKNWTKDILGFVCPWKRDLADAQSVAAKLDISFKIYDFETEYKQKVVDYMIEAYQAGLTPNPDIMCNQEIKFKLFLNTALSDGADKIATGHYARITPTHSQTLQKGLDEAKDQSYFLYRITKKALENTLMPLGELHKSEVRKLAKKIGLATAEKPDSQGICFIGEVSIKDFLKDNISTKPGEIKSLSGRVLGEHEGAVFYTIGQRQGLGIGGGLPFYVVDKDMKKNIVYVTSDLTEGALWKDVCYLVQAHWINESPIEDKEYEFKLRYRSKSVLGKLKKVEGRYLVKLNNADRAVTPGQSAVVYYGEMVLGGGIIA